MIVKKCYVSNWKEVNSVFNNLEPFDYLINNAGVAITASFLEVTEQDIDTTFDINIKAIISNNQGNIPSSNYRLRLSFGPFMNGGIAYE